MYDKNRKFVRWNKNFETVTGYTTQEIAKMSPLDFFAQEEKDVVDEKMDGLEATRRLRFDVRFATIPIIALTALAMPGDRERCLQAGANEYMSKPVSLKELRKVIEDFISSKK